MLAKIEFSLICLALAGCGSRSLMVGRDAGTARDSTAMNDSAALPDSAANGDAFVGNDVFVPDDTLPDLFCSGDSAHMVVNGIESYPVVTGRMLPLDCCDAGLFTVTTQTFAEQITFRWQRFFGSFQYPASVDLSNPGSDWSLRLVAGCDPVLSSCSGPGDAYTTGLEGLLDIAQGGSQIDMSLCLHVVEPAGSPHSLIHTLDLHAPHVLATF